MCIKIKRKLIESIYDKDYCVMVIYKKKYLMILFQNYQMLKIVNIDVFKRIIRFICYFISPKCFNK